MEMADLWSGTLTFALAFVGFVLRGSPALGAAAASQKIRHGISEK